MSDGFPLRARFWGHVDVRTPAPDLTKLLNAWEEFERGDNNPARCWRTSRPPAAGRADRADRDRLDAVGADDLT